MLKISHKITLYFLRYAHLTYVKSLFTNIQKQQNIFLRNVQTSLVNNSRILRIDNAKFSEYCFHMNTNIQGDFQICISVPLTFRGNLQVFSRISRFFNKFFWILQVLIMARLEGLKLTFFLQSRLLLNLFYCFCMFVNKTFTYLGCAYIKSYGGV